jgi:hypothetical protein
MSSVRFGRDLKSGVVVDNGISSHSIARSGRKVSHYATRLEDWCRGRRSRTNHMTCLSSHKLKAQQAVEHNILCFAKVINGFPSNENYPPGCSPHDSRSIRLSGCQPESPPPRALRYPRPPCGGSTALCGSHLPDLATIFKSHDTVCCRTISHLLDSMHS